MSTHACTQTQTYILPQLHGRNPGGRHNAHTHTHLLTHSTRAHIYIQITENTSPHTLFHAGFAATCRATVAIPLHGTAAEACALTAPVTAADLHARDPKMGPERAAIPRKNIIFAGVF